MGAPGAVLVMGVSGSGKSTVGALLASELGWKFYDADDYHPEENRMKMAKGIPLNDQVPKRKYIVYSFAQYIKRDFSTVEAQRH